MTTSPNPVTRNTQRRQLSRRSYRPYRRLALVFLFLSAQVGVIHAESAAPEQAPATQTPPRAVDSPSTPTTGKGTRPEPSLIEQKQFSEGTPTRLKRLGESIERKRAIEADKAVGEGTKH